MARIEFEGNEGDSLRVSGASLTTFSSFHLFATVDLLERGLDGVSL